MPPVRGARRVALAALLLGAMVLAAVACRGEDTPPPLASGVWLAIPPAANEIGPVRLVHPSSGFEREVGEAGRYHSAAWSPDGERVAAIRQSDGQEVVIFDSRGEEAPVPVPIDMASVRLSWSPDSARLAVYGPAGALLLAPEGEVIGEFPVPPDVPDGDGLGPGEWDSESTFFAAQAAGMLLVMQRNGVATFFHPDTFVRNPGETQELVVSEWASEEGLVSVFVRSGEDRTSLFTVDVTAEPPEIVAASDFDGDAGPYDGLLNQARERTGEDVVLGQHSAPASLRWVVTIPAAAANLPEVWVRPEEEFEFVRDFAPGTRDAAWIAANLGVFYLRPPATPSAR